MVTGIAEHNYAIGRLFEMEGKARASHPLPFSPQIPPLKSPFGKRHCVPLHATPAPVDVDTSEFSDGARRLGFVPSVHQERFARIMGAAKPDGLPASRRTVMTMPRRSGKTDGLMALIIGRCSNREDYHAAFSAQSGKMGRKRFLSMAAKLERWDPDPDRDRYRIYRSNGGERIEWKNGSTFDINPPDPESYRGDEYDLIVLDEGQETTDDETTDELLGGINPTMDTKPSAQLVVAGTAGKVRAGLLWRSLEKGRAGVWGILEYAVPDHVDPETDETAMLAHPGIGTLTTLEVIRENRDDLSLVDYQREYLGQWPHNVGVSAIDPEHWAAGKVDERDRGDRPGVAFDVAPDASAGAITCAWRDEAGVAYIELLAYRSGVSWIAAEAAKIATSARVPVAHDTIGQCVNVADTLARRRTKPAVKLAPLRLADMQGATQRLVSGLADGTIKHFGQKDLDLAAEGANWRNTPGETARLLGHKPSTAGITPLTAAALALWQYDKQTAGRRRRRQRPTTTPETAR